MEYLRESRGANGRGVRKRHGKMIKRVEELIVEFTKHEPPSGWLSLIVPTVSARIAEQTVTLSRFIEVAEAEADRCYLRLG